MSEGRQQISLFGFNSVDERARDRNQGGLFSGKVLSADDMVEKGGRFDDTAQQGKNYRVRYFRSAYFDALKMIKAVAVRYLTTSLCLVAVADTCCWRSPGQVGPHHDRDRIAVSLLLRHSNSSSSEAHATARPSAAGASITACCVRRTGSSSEPAAYSISKTIWRIGSSFNQLPAAERAVADVAFQHARASEKGPLPQDVLDVLNEAWASIAGSCPPYFR